MKSVKHLGWALAAAILLGGCVSKGPLRNNPGAFFEFSDDQPTTIQIDINRILFNEICVTHAGTTTPSAECDQIESGLPNLLGESTSPDTFKTRNTDGVQVFSNLLLALEKLSPERQTKVRNAAAYQMLAASEHGCRNYLFTLRGVQTNTRFGTDLWSGVFASAASLTNASDPSNLYSALSAFGILTGSSVDRSYFANQALEPVRVAIDTKRLTMRTEIANKLSGSYADYPFGIAMSDLIRYHSACSLMEGLSDVSQAVSGRETAVRTSRLVAQRLNIADATGAQIVAALTGVEEAQLAVEPKPPAAATKPPLNLLADIEAANADVFKAITKTPVEGPAAFDAARAIGKAICVSDPKTPKTVLCRVTGQLNGDTKWWESTKAKLSPISGDTAEAKAAYKAEFESSLDQKLKALSEDDDLKRNVAFRTVEQLAKSKTLTRKQAQSMGAAELLDSKPIEDPVLELLRQGFAVSDKNADESLAAPSAILAIEFVTAYLSKFK